MSLVTDSPQVRRLSEKDCQLSCIRKRLTGQKLEVDDVLMRAKMSSVAFIGYACVSGGGAKGSQFH